MFKLSHNDEPNLEDDFNQEFLNQLCDVVNNCQPPKALAVTGYWGAGKTSALRQLYWQLSGEAPPGCKPPKPFQNPRGPDLLPVWFEAWRFQHEPQPIAALLHAIRIRLGLLEKFIGASKKHASIALLSSLHVFDELIKIVSSAPIAGGGTFSPIPKFGEIMASGEKWEKDRYLNKLPSEQLANLLEEAIQQALKGEKKRLLVFIDDLDRCLPNAALRLLEGIKIYLNLKNCIIVFGMDRRQLEHGLLEALSWIDRKDAQERSQAAYYASEYLEKICQDTHPLPIPDGRKKAGYLAKLLRQLDKTWPEECIEALQGILQQFDCLPANPRKIKMLANRIALIMRAASPPAKRDAAANGDDFLRPYKLLLLASIVCTFHKDVHEQLDRNPSYVLELVNYNLAVPDARKDEARFAPMHKLVFPKQGSNDLPVNPSDSNVFRLHELLKTLDPITEEELLPFLRLG